MASPSTALEGSAEPAQVTAADGRFQVTFTLPRIDWRAGEAISGEARLSVAGQFDASISHAGNGPFGFEFVALDGHHRVDPVWLMNCSGGVVAANAPSVSPIERSGAWSEDDPDAEFYRGFFHDPELHLPPGNWDITALAIFNEGYDCEGESHSIRATFRVHISA